MYYYGYQGGYGYNGYNNCCGQQYNPCCCGGGFGGGSGYGYGAAIILVLFILLVIVIGSRLVG